MKLQKLLQRNSETQEQFMDRCYHLQGDWRTRVEGNVLVFPSPAPFHNQEVTEKISHDLFIQRLSCLPVESDRDETETVREA
jgi:hypothetical protein